MTAIPSPQPSDGTILEWRVFPPGFHFAATATPSASPVYTPTPGPVILVIHGGDWNLGDPFLPDIERVCEILAQQGFWVFDGDYRLAPCKRITNQPGHVVFESGRPPEQTDDVMALMIAAKNSPHCRDGKVGVLGSSVGGFLSAYAALYPDPIDETGRPHWVPADDRPTCVVTVSSPFDLADQLPEDAESDGHPKYLQKLQNYIGNCDIEDAREASPVYQVNRASVSDFRPMFMVQAHDDDVNPHRQIDDMVNALKHAQVDPCDYTVSYFPEGEGGGHALILWNQQDPNYPDCSSHTIGDSVIAFFHEHLD